MMTIKRYPPDWKQRLQMLGWTSFLFFLIKGLLWLSLPAVITYIGMVD